MHIRNEISSEISEKLFSFLNMIDKIDFLMIYLLTNEFLNKIKPEILNYKDNKKRYFEFIEKEKEKNHISLDSYNLLISKSNNFFECIEYNFDYQFKRVNHENRIKGIKEIINFNS